MRPGQNKRMRGRNRKGPNPLTRSFESNGPDVKVRGTAAHIAEKYVQLARDAHSSGDPVAAESYLQHAEHYYRLLMAAQQTQSGSFQQHGNGGGGYQQRPQEAVDLEDGEEGDDEFDGGVMDRFTFRAPQPVHQPQNGNGGQPYYQGERGGEAEGDEQPREVRPERNDGQRQDRGDGQRQDRGEYRGYDNRGPRQDRNDRQQRFRDRDRDRDRERGDRQPYGDRQQHQPAPQPRPIPVDAEQPSVGLPAFITGSSRPQPSPEPVEAAHGADVPAAAAEQPAPRRRGRRPRSESQTADLPANEDKDITPAAE